VNTFVIDASIAVKWVVGEHRTPEALALRQKAKLIAPELRSPSALISCGKKFNGKNF
jgi:predicted nucleic acid-binding protein